MLQTTLNGADTKDPTITSSGIENVMGLKVSLSWYDKKTEFVKGKEYSIDLEDDGSIIEALGLMDDSSIYDGRFDVEAAWIPKLQSLFSHKIDAANFDYQVSFRYRKAW